MSEYKLGRNLRSYSLPSAIDKELILRLFKKKNCKDIMKLSLCLIVFMLVFAGMANAKILGKRVFGFHGKFYLFLSFRSLGKTCFVEK